MYPIQDGPSVPWEVMAPHESQCQKNHGQSIQRIAERGGFGCSEAWAVVNALDYYKAIETGIGHVEAKRLWIAFAERINNHYAKLEELRSKLAALRERYENELKGLFTLDRRIRELEGLLLETRDFHLRYEDRRDWLERRDNALGLPPEP